MLGFRPRYTTAEAFADFVAAPGAAGLLSPDVVGPSRTASGRASWPSGRTASRCLTPGSSRSAANARAAHGRPRRADAVAAGRVPRLRRAGPAAAGTSAARPSATPAVAPTRADALDARRRAGERPPRTTAEPIRPGPAADERAGRPRRPRAAADWERKVAGGLAFLRRRLTGDYEVDEFGYDEELTDQVLMSLLRPLYEKYFRVEVKGIENIPAEGGALIVANHSGTLPLDGLMIQVAVHDHHPAQPASAAARRRPGVHAAGRQRTGPQGRSHPGLRRGRRAAAGARRARRCDAGGLQGHRQAVLRALQAPALRPGRLRLDGAAQARCRSCRARSSAPRRSTR